MTIAAALALPRDSNAPGVLRTHPSLPPTPRAAVPAFRVPPRVYSPYRPRRLARPMAVPRGADRRPGAPPGRLAWRLFRARRG